MYQNLTIMGSVGRDAETRYLPTGQQMAVFSVAATRQHRDKNGALQKETTWYQLSTFGKLAEFCTLYVRKGARVLVTGRLRPDPQSGGPRLWTKRDGKVGASYEVMVESLRLLDWPDNDVRGGFAVDEPDGLEPVMDPELPDEYDMPF